MVNSVADFTAQTFAHTQKNKSTANSAGNSAALKTNKAAKQAIMQHIEQTTIQGKNLMQRATSANALSANPAPDSNLPRGSLIDIIV